MSKAPHEAEIMDWACATASDPGINDWTRLCAQRYIADRQDPRWDFRPALPEFCIELIEGLFCIPQGEDIDGRPLRGAPFRMQPWQLFATYNIGGFYWPGTELRRFTEAGIFAPRKTVKTTWGDALIWTMALWYRLSGAKAKSVAGSLKQGMEGFDFLCYNMDLLDLIAENNPPGYLVKMDSSLGHSISGEMWRGYIEFETLAYKPDLFDSFNAQFIHLDELELYKNAIPYGRLRDATKAYGNKLILSTFTAGDDAVGFAARHHDYLQKILRGTITGIDADRTFAFVAEAPRREDGSVDYTNPDVHRAANPAYGVTVRPNDMLAAALQAQQNPELRMEFLTRSLNVFVGSFKAWFNLDEFRASDARYDWTQADAARLIRNWYGGADLSRLHDLTAAVIVGEIPAAKAATASWTPPEDVLVVLPHAWFPITAAAEKAKEDEIPLFGWEEDGWLDMPNTSSMDPTEPVRQFRKWRDLGFHIRKVGHDRKFAKKYCEAMEREHFPIVDQPQLAISKSEGLRYIEHKAKVGCIYFFHAEPYEYCVSNVKGREKQDDVVVYEKISDTSRIDLFDASVFAVIRMLADTQRLKSAAAWFQSGDKTDGV